MYIQYENKTYSIYKQVYRSERETGQPGEMSYILTATAKKTSGRVGTIHFAICLGYNVSTLFQNLQ